LHFNRIAATTFAMRVLIDRDPLINPNDFFHENSPWPAKWIGHPDHHGDESVVIAYRRKIKLDASHKFRIHISADQRYELYLDGKSIGRGPERGDLLNWFYETHELNLGGGEHVIVAKTWWLRDDAPTAYAQITAQPAFFLMVEGLKHEILSTGVAPWECKVLPGHTFLKPQVGNAFLVSGAKVQLDGGQFPWGCETGSGDGWIAAKEVAQAYPASIQAEARPRWLLRPALLPAMLDNRIHVGVARHVESVVSLDLSKHPVSKQNHLPDEAAGWNDLLAGKSPLAIPPHTMRRVIVDLDNYYCAFPEVMTRGAAGATIRAHWAESLFVKPNTWEKGNRNEIEGKFFNGIGDTFITAPIAAPNGSSGPATYSTIWFETGRYIELVIQTKDEPLTIDSVAFRETHFPHEFESTFTSSDDRLEKVIPIALRTLEMCSHETYMDCPYYEQLMYVGDTRLQVLVTYATTRNDALPRKAIEMFDLSRAQTGGHLTMARYPTKVLQTIPPFSLWWIGMLHDYMMWRGDRDFIAARMPGARAVIDAFLARVNRDDLLESPAGWNFVDWVPGWSHGCPPAAHNGINGTLNWHLVYTLLKAAEIERFLGEQDLSRRYTERAAEISVGCDAFWDETRGLFAEDLKKTTFSEHTQSLALLSHPLAPTHRQKLAPALLSDPNLARTTIYFRHYLFEVFHLIGRTDLILDRMDLWFSLPKNGNRTTIEMPEPTRSDCHAWGAHPVYHYFASILGIRPLEPGFARVSLTPQLGPLTRAKGEMVHPKGMTKLDLEQRDGQLFGDIELPDTITGVLNANGAQRELHCGKQRV
jgi:hypothetical protein